MVMDDDHHGTIEVTSSADEATSPALRDLRGLERS
jgi:hypothetical protein